MFPGHGYRASTSIVSEEIASLKPPAESIDRELFTSLAGREVIPNAGHFLPRENPNVVVSALLKILENTK
jgi:pimeloyl-ACP methyl ester carboxylesterase